MATTLAKWHRLDNSAKIFPMMTNKKNKNMFVLDFTLYDEVDPVVLQKALTLTIDRFPSFRVKLMSGIFWYYFEHNNLPPLVYPMSDIAFRKINHTNCNGYCFRVCYFGKRISAEFFHAICDGSGAGEFMKSLLYTYFNLLEKNVNSHKKVLTINSPIDPKEFEDSFLTYYQKVKLKDLKLKSFKVKPAYKINGVLFENNNNGIINVYCDSKKLLGIAREHNCTVTELVASLLILSIYDTQIKDTNKTTDDIALFLPINLRKIFPSITLRNFTLFSRVFANTSSDMQLKKLITIVHDCLLRDTNKDTLSNKISATVRAEKFLPMRIMPLFLKKIIFAVSNRVMGKKKKTATFSNIGVFPMPEDMQGLIDKVSFGINANPASPMTLTGVTVFDTFCLTFVRCITETKIEKRFVEYLQEIGLDVTVRSNYWEVANAL